jgi:two-component system, response regulator PdtaR
MADDTKPSVVLVVEDEAILRAMASSIFSTEGFHVVEAATGDDAAGMLETDPEVHLLFTDVHVPGSLDGLALAWHVMKHWPGIRIIIVSGRVKLQPHEMPPGSRFCSKPYDPRTVLNHAREMLSA